jgi:toxin secretion/phage lysis holin
MNKIKVFFTAVLSALAGWLGILAIPVLILVLSNIIDYGTGLVASPYRGQKIDSYKSFRGIAKKICMWLLVFVGAMIDQLLIYAGKTVGITLPITFLVACVVAIWLICNEIISILENIADIGVKLPPFLAPIVKNIKKQVEDKATIKEAGTDE